MQNMLREELGLLDLEQPLGGEPSDESAGELTGELTQQHLVQRLFRIENTVELIQASLLEAAEHGETRHEHLLQHLEDLKDDVVRNHRLLRELRDRGCFQTSRECLFAGALAVVALWLYFVHSVIGQ